MVSGESFIATTIIVFLSCLLIIVWDLVLHKGPSVYSDGDGQTIRRTPVCENIIDSPAFIFTWVLLGAAFISFQSLWGRLLVFVSTAALFYYTIAAFVVTNKGAGAPLPHRGYKEYKLEDYSHWFQKHADSTKNWNKAKSCLIDNYICYKFSKNHVNETLEDFHKGTLSSVQSGCCKPPDSCGFHYVSSVNWTKGSAALSADPDCATWDDPVGSFCLNCNSCKAGVVDKLKHNWRRVAVVSLICLIVILVLNCLAIWFNLTSDTI